MLEPFASAYANHGQRVVEGQRLMQAASDILLGWTSIADRDYCARQLRDVKGSIPVDKLTASELVDYERVCGAALTHGRATRSRSPHTWSAEMCSTGRSRRFAVAYANQTEKDHEQLLEAIRSGELQG